jgi:hypothetical protein
MRVEKNRDKPIFCCRKYNCRKSLSSLTGTWLERVRLTKLQVLKLVFLFCCHRPVTQAMEIAGVASEAAVNWYKFCRQVFQIVNQNLPFVPIGGPGLTVEVDETALWRRKYNKGRILRKQTQWIFAGICRETKRVFVVPVRVRGAYANSANTKVCWGSIGRSAAGYHLFQWLASKFGIGGFRL